MTTETKGFTLSAVATRVQKIDGVFTWKVYTALATLARLTGSSKSVVTAKIFGTEKPSKDFANAWSRAGHVYSRFYGEEGQRAAVRLLGIDDAEKAAIKCISDHMLALGVAGKNAYDQLIEFGSKEEIDAAAAIAAAAAVTEAAEALPEPVVSPAGESNNVVTLAEAAAMPDAFDTVATAFNALDGDGQLSLIVGYIEGADMTILNLLAQTITARMLAASEQRIAA